MRVYLDVCDKSNSVIEVLDDGDGMGAAELKTYVKIGYDKRAAYRQRNAVNSAPQTIMGRKGIGKLAALYLSPHYYVISKQLKGEEECWEMQYSPNSSDQDKPTLKRCYERPIIACAKEWRKAHKGTLIRMSRADLSGMDDDALAVLGDKLAQHFSLGNMNGKQILLCVRKQHTDKIEFLPLKRTVAFGNMAFISEFLNDENLARTLLGRFVGRAQSLKCGSNGDKFNRRIEVDSIAAPCREYQAKAADGRLLTVQAVLTGWIGIHCTINEKEGQSNDELFKRNKFYNPNQLRLYVRNKLAVENFLTVVNSTKTYANYIEGEIHFDVLDDDGLPDIATSNRQGIDEHDKRVVMLKDMVNPLITTLIRRREELASEIRKEAKRRENERDTAAKEQFSKEVTEELKALKGASEHAKSELASAIVNKIRGDVRPKSDRVVFISHASFDKIFSDFLFWFLRDRGVMPKELFYTSRTDDQMRYKDLRPLQEKIRECIVSANTKLLYVAGEGFKKSEYCLFEGGAGWATRAASEYSLVAVKYSHIPTFLTNGKDEIALFKDGKIELNAENYQYLVSVLNDLIEHINSGRRIVKALTIPPILKVEIPPPHELAAKKKRAVDYMDGDVVKMWRIYVRRKLKKYLQSLS